VKVDHTYHKYALCNFWRAPQGTICEQCGWVKLVEDDGNRHVGDINNGTCKTCGKWLFKFMWPKEAFSTKLADFLNVETYTMETEKAKEKGIQDSLIHLLLTCQKERSLLANECDLSHTKNQDMMETAEETRTGMETAEADGPAKEGEGPGDLGVGAKTRCGLKRNTLTLYVPTLSPHPVSPQKSQTQKRRCGYVDRPKN